MSAGPSCLKVRRGDLLRGPVVAINRAITVRNRVPVHVWAVWDHPKRLMDLGYAKFVKPPLTIWLGPIRFHEFYLAARGVMQEPEWEKMIPAEVGFRCMCMGMVGEEGKNRIAPTLFYALEKAAELGAKRIRILGADMKGTHAEEGGFHPESWRPGDGVINGWDRWAHEREQLSLLIEKFDRQGIEVEQR